MTIPRTGIRQSNLFFDIFNNVQGTLLEFNVQGLRKPYFEQNQIFFQTVKEAVNISKKIMNNREVMLQEKDLITYISFE